MDRLQARLAVVEEHVRCENRHDLDGRMASFGGDARYDDEPWGDRRAGRDGVRAYDAKLSSHPLTVARALPRKSAGSDRA